MKDKNDMRIKRKIGALVVLGILTMVLLPLNVSATDDFDWGTSGNDVYTGVVGDPTYKTGNVGIGLTNPGAKLEVKPTITTTADFTGIKSGLVYNGASAMTNWHGMYVEAPTGSGTITNKYALVTESGAGKVGIGDTSPDFKLEVTGSSGSGYFGVTSTTDGDIFIIDSSGNVGIGTPSPNGLLDIEYAGTPRANTDVFHISNSVYDGTGIIDTETSILFNQKTNEAFGPAMVDAGRITVGVSSPWLNTATTQDSYMAFHTGLDGSVREWVRIISNGNMGIGVTDPAEKLEVNGNILFNTGADRTMVMETPSSSSDGYDLTIEAGDGYWVSGLPGYGGGDLYLGAGDGVGSSYSNGGDVIIYGGDRGADAVYGDVILAHTGTTARGRVGVGTTSPQNTLDVRGGLSVSYSNSIDSTFRTDSSGYLSITAHGQNVGIGTSSPNHGVHIVDNTNAVGRAALYVSQTGLPTSGRTLYGSYVTNTGSGSGYNVGGYFSATGAANNYGLIVENGDVGIGTTSPDKLLHIGSSGGTSGAIRFEASDGDEFDLGITTSNQFYIIGGNVGIGTNSPDDVLEVSGVLQIDTDSAPISGTQDNLRLGEYSTENYKWIQSYNLHPLSINPLGNNVGIGETNPSSKLEVNGDVELTDLEDNDGSNFFDGVGNSGKTITQISSTGALSIVDIAISESQVSGVITGVTAGNGLDGGGDVGDVTLDVDVTDLLGDGLREDNNKIEVWGLTSQDGDPQYALFADNEGEIGIGIAPGYPLDVAGDIHTSTAFKVGGAPTGPTIYGNGYITPLSTTDFNIHSGKIYIDAQPFGYVGIGTDTPGAHLEISSSQSWGPYLMFDNQGTDMYTMGVDTTDGNKFKIGTTWITTNTRLTIDSNGYIGIGTPNPNAKLTIEDGDVQIHETGTTSDPFIKWSVGGTQSSPTQSYVMRIDNDDGDKLQIRDTKDSRTIMTFDGDGKVGIGATNPDAGLDVDIDVTANGVNAIGINYDGTLTADSNSDNLYGLHIFPNFQKGGYSDIDSIGLSAIASNGDTNKGVVGMAIGSNSLGVIGDAAGTGASYGVYGTAGGDGTNYGIYGDAHGGTTNWAGYFDRGNVYMAHELEVADDLDVGGVGWFEGGAVIGAYDPDDNYFLDALADGGLWAISKYFIINHTLNNSKYLVHASLEGPEHGVFYRGNGTLINGSATIYLPEYYNSLTMNDSYTVLLTAKGNTPFTLSYDSFNETAFTVYGSVQSGDFDWEVKATRQDVEQFEVEPDKNPE